MEILDDSSKNSAFLKSERLDPSFPSVTERYFTPKIEYDNDHCILVHSNRLCLITLAPTHPILVKQLEIKSVNFEVSGHQNRLNNKVCGKWKKGGQKLKKMSLICTIKVNDEQEYLISSCINGTLVEINENLIGVPNLLRHKPWSDGYIAIVLPPFTRSIPKG